MADERIILDYAKGVPHWRKWVRRGVVAAVFVLLATAGWYWRKDISQPVAAWYWQRQCLNFEASAMKVVWEGDPTAAKALLGTHPTEYAKWVVDRPYPSEPPMGAVLRVPCWLKFCLASSPPDFYGYSRTPCFLHERVSRGTGGGQVRLVMVDNNNTWMNWHVYSRASPWRATLPPKEGGNPSVGALDISSRVYAGQPDPNDPSHFMIEYERWGQRDTIDGWLEADDTVTLKARHPPLAPGAGTKP